MDDDENIGEKGEGVSGVADTGEGNEKDAGEPGATDKGNKQAIAVDAGHGADTPGQGAKVDASGTNSGASRTAEGDMARTTSGKEGQGDNPGGQGSTDTGAAGQDTGQGTSQAGNSPASPSIVSPPAATQPQPVQTGTTEKPRFRGPTPVRRRQERRWEREQANKS